MNNNKFRFCVTTVISDGLDTPLTPLILDSHNIDHDNITFM
jgi:hypothetical protein